jgi:transcriptional regulator with XRE-family HTH domain
MDIAEIMDISCRTNISKWECGRQYPTMIDLLKLCALYQVAPGDLYPEHTEALQATLAQRKQAFFTRN